MVREILHIRTDKGLGNNNPSFYDIEITEYSYKGSRMGMPSLSATLMWKSCLDDEWSGMEYVVLNGERFYIRHTPSSSKSNTDSRYKHEIDFVSEYAEILGNTFFVDAVPSHAVTYDKPCTNNTTFKFYGTISEFVDRLNCAFLYKGIGDSILNNKTSLTINDEIAGDGFCAMLDPFGSYDKEESYEFSWEDKKLWDAITEGFNITEIPFERRGRKIIFGAVPKIVEHKFEYGYDNELLSVSKKNAKAQVVNRTTMVGSSENIPYYYPNETEYGHISIAAKTGNKILTADMVEIANMTQLLSRLNADSFAVLGKYDGSSSGNANARFLSCSTSFANGEFTPYSLGDYLKHNPSGTARNIPWHIRITFKVISKGEVVFRDVRGHVWIQNNTPSDAGVNMIENIKPEKLETSDGVDLSTQINKQQGQVSLGQLEAGDYVFQFSINIVNKEGGRDTPVVSYCYLSSVGFGSASTGKTGYYWAVGDKKYDGVGALGIKISENITDAMIGDGFGWVASGRMPFQDHLMPPKYRETLGAERFYEALNDTYTDPDTGNKYVFPNPFIEGAPSEYIFRDDNRKPTIEGMTNANGQLMGVIADIAYDDNDNDVLKPDSEEGDKNDALKYEHSFFYIKLNIFNGDYGFDLFAHASQTDPMTLQMRSGSCDGCKFKIQALEYEDSIGLKSYKNPVQTTGANGAIVNGGYSDKVKESWQGWQQNTQTHSIWICVQKDADTFGVLMPNQSNNFKPKIGDKFNIINIDLPQSYILAAEKRLEEDGIRNMSDNNEEKFTFDISASRIYLAEHPEIVDQLDEYSVIKVLYNGQIYEQYVSQLTIDCKNSEALPNIGIDLTDTLAVGQSFVENVAERAASLVANANTLGGNLGGGMNMSIAEKRYINKQKDDRTPYKVASDRGFEIGEFVSGGSGGIFFIDPETGQSYLEVDKIKARMKAIFAELEVAKEKSIGGKFDITPGGGIDISFVEELADSYRCYFKAKEEDKGANCRFVVGDQARCNESNISNGTTQDASNRYYWRLVTAVNNDESYIELSKTDCDEGSMAPIAGDTVVQLGNRNDAERQSAIILSTVDAYAPCVTLYNGIDHYSLENKSVVEYGVDKSQDPPEPFFNCYGRFFFGPRSKNSYLKFNPSDEMLEYKGILHIDSQIGDKTIEDYVKGIISFDEYDYLKAALQQDTDIVNGLILTSAVLLGYKNDLGERVTMAGHSGLYNTPKSIASFWGGDMVDKFYDANGNLRETPLESGYANALMRMDGSAYLNGGASVFNPDKSGYLVDGKIRWDSNGAITFGSGILIDLGNGGSTTLGGIEKSLASVVSLVNNMSNYLTPMVKKPDGSVVATTWDKITDSNPLFAVRSIKGFYSEEFITAHGIHSGSSGGSTGIMYGRLDEWEQYVAGNGDVLSADLGYGLRNSIDAINNKLNQLPTNSVNPYALTIQRNGVTLGSYDGSEPKTINIDDVASASALNTHIADTAIHITSAERTLWNATATNLNAILGADSDTIINKWEEVVAFLDTYTEADTLANLLSNKANWATTLAGYGIADAYTKTEVNTLLGGKLDSASLSELLVPCDSDGNELAWSDSANAVSLKAKIGLWSVNYITAHGMPSGSVPPTSGAVADLLKSWSAYDAESMGDYALSAALGYELHTRLSNLGDGDFVTVNTAQEITGKKSFRNTLEIKSSTTDFASLPTIVFHIPDVVYTKLVMNGGDGSMHLLRGAATGFNDYRSLTVGSIIKYGGTSSQFLKADGSVDSNAYLTSHQSLDYIKVHDIRNTTPKPNENKSYQLRAWFNNQDAPSNSAWYSGITIQGWTSASNYAGWQLASDADNAKDPNLYFRIGQGDAWQSWQKVLTSGNVSSYLTYIVGLGRVTSANLASVGDKKMTIFQAVGGIMTSGHPGEDGTILNFNWDNTSNYGSQLFLGHSNMYWRAQGGLAYSERSWRKVLDSSNYSAVLDSRYVHENYIKCNYGTPTLQWTWGSNLTHVVGFNGDSGVMMVYNGTNIRNFANAVNKDGDTMTGVLSLKANMYSDAYDGALNMNNSDIYNLNSIYTSDLAETSQEGFHFYRDATHVDTIWVNNGVMRFSPNRSLGTTSPGYVVWHSGNMSSGSGLDADLLDGVHLTSLFRRLPDNMDLNGQVDGNNNNGIVYIHAGLAGWNGNNFPFGYGSVLNLSADAQSVQIAFPHNWGNPLYRQKWWQGGGGSWSAWKTIAFTDSNVASANKLYTARSLWGNNFDGTNGVSGALHIWSDGSLYNESIRIHPASNGWNAIVFCGDDNTGSSGTSAKTWGIFTNADSNLYINKNGSNSHTGYELCNVGGNWGIGTTDPTDKLTVDGWVTTIGATGWYNKSYAGGMYMSDSNWVRNYNNKPLYIRADNNTYGIGGHRLAAEFAGTLHTSILLNVAGANVAYGICVNQDGNMYIGRRTNGTDTTATNDKYILTLKEAELSMNGSIYSSSGISSAGGLSVNQNTGVGTGISLYYSTAYVKNYGIMFAKTANFGTFSGDLTGDWATYFTMDGASNRGWIFRHAVNGNVACINGLGNAVFRLVTVCGDIGASWNNGWGAYNAQITNDNKQTPLLLAYRRETSNGNTACANRLFAMEFLNSGLQLNYAFGGANKFTMHSNGVFYAVTGIYSDGYITAHGTPSSSDARLKNVLGDVHLSLQDIANAPAVRFIWKKEGIEDVGSIAQYWEKVLPQVVRNDLDDYLAMDYGKAALLASINLAKVVMPIQRDYCLVVKKIDEHESKINNLEAKCNRLESENQQLRKENNEFRKELQTLKYN